MSGSADYLGVDTGELGTFGNDLRISAGTVKNAVKSVTDNTFGTGTNGKELEAGRNYAAQGKEIAKGMELAAKWLRDWSSAAEAIANSVGAAVVAYSDTDTENAKKQNAAK